MNDCKTTKLFFICCLFYNGVPHKTPIESIMGFHLLRLLRSRHTSGRSIFQPEGNEHYEFVRIGNLLANRVCLLIWVATAYGLRWLLEQPDGSASSRPATISTLLGGDSGEFEVKNAFYSTVF